jgi:hypothetical protein
MNSYQSISSYPSSTNLMMITLYGLSCTPQPCLRTILRTCSRYHLDLRCPRYPSVLESSGALSPLLNGYRHVNKPLISLRFQQHGTINGSDAVALEIDSHKLKCDHSRPRSTNDAQLTTSLDLIERGFLAMLS